MFERVVIVDGYVDEPTCLGVPPYISPYPRYIAGAIWTEAPRTEILYQTIDQVRADYKKALSPWQSADILILIAGMIVPGKYIGGTPISVKEAARFFSARELHTIPKLLVGPWARFGCGLQGGRLALSSDVLSPPFNHIISGDPEIVINQIFKAKGNLDSVDYQAVRTEANEIEEYAIRGSQIVTQHPNMSRAYIICEIETYRGCPRYITGGCSFCVEPLYRVPSQRNSVDIAKEIEALYQHGVKAFRIGRQADLFTYGSQEMGDAEFPQPCPDAIENLFSRIRNAAPKLNVLHIDNVNPGTISKHPKESLMIAKIIIKHHTSGDVAALGVESTDPEVIKKNNLKATDEEAIEAVRILNKAGRNRSVWGLPQLLPGINLLYGLDGERSETLDYNMAFLQRLLEEGLLVRRINIRQVIGFPGTRMSKKKRRGIRRHDFFTHRAKIREIVDKEMIKKVAPPGTIIQSVFVDGEDGNNYLLRQLGTYPLLCHMPKGANGFIPQDVFAVDHGPRSLTVLPHPFRPKQASLSQWKAFPGIGNKRATRIKATASLSSISDVSKVLDMDLPEWFTKNLEFNL